MAVSSATRHWSHDRKGNLIGQMKVLQSISKRPVQPSHFSRTSLRLFIASPRGRFQQVKQPQSCHHRLYHTAPCFLLLSEPLHINSTTPTKLIMAESSEPSLSRLFSQAKADQDDLDNVDPRSANFKDLLHSIVTNLQRCRELIQQLSLFSPNEEVEDISTSNLQ
jgi:hypothetical protein